MNNKISSKLKSYTFLRGNLALFSWFFWISFILFVALYVANIVILFSNPNQLANFKPNQDVFLGFYNLDVNTNNLYLNWIVYLFGSLIIVITAINCIAYWLLATTDVQVMIRKKEIIILFLTSVISLVLIYILNIFNRPLFDITKLNLVDHNWSIDQTQNIVQMQFNYVYDITIVNDPNVTLNSYLYLSKFSAIWILMIIITLLLYVVSFFVCLYYSRDYLYVFSKKEYLY